MSLLNNSNAISTGGDYNLENSLRFRSSASAYLSRTPTTAGNRKTWTYSAWVKLGDMSTTRLLFLGGTADGSSTRGTNLFIYPSTSGTAPYQLGLSSYGIGTNKSAIIFRDPSAWYHIVLSIDTTQATAANRTRLYVNGIENSFDTQNFAQNVDTGINSTTQHEINGNFGVGVGDGYLTEVNFVDGQALTPSDFGDTNEDTGVWQPIKYTGTYGTNGFYLPMNQGIQGYNIEYLVVAGGGGGGWRGGGGAGGYRTDPAFFIENGSTYTVTVGNGGTASSANDGIQGATGGNSVFGSITSLGGGGGGGSNSVGLVGGSGGGGGINNGQTTVYAGGAGTASQGTAGGDSFQPTGANSNGGGGGGATSVGSNAPSAAVGGNGGSGTASSITGSSVTYAGGGGGGANTTAGSGGSGGGGAGSNGAANATPGTANTGGGGGGGAPGRNAGIGGSGVVILRIATSSYTGTVTGSPTVTTDGSDTVVKFTASGSYTA